MSSRRAAAQQFLAIAACAALIALYLPLATNPGWFSHDELQWGEPAQVARFVDLPWVAWWDLHAFQWRPLTFNLWLVAAWALHATPPSMHLLWLALGAGVCALLYATLRGFGLARPGAAAAIAAFAANPFAVYVHGWTATLAELAWVACALGLACVVLRVRRESLAVPAVAGLAFASLALMAKEAALAIAPLLLLAWAVRGREPRWLAACIGAAIPTLAYLVSRLSMLLFDPRPFDGYAWSPAAIPLRWLEMQTWPFLVTSFELGGVMRASSSRLGLAIGVATLLALVAFRAHRRLGIGFVIGGLLAIGPALVLLQPYPQYGYAWSALACACLAAAWPRVGTPSRATLLVALVLSSWHGFNVQREMRRVGELERAFTPSLRDAARREAALHLYVEAPRDAWIYRRLLVPVELGSTGSGASVVVERGLATHRVAADGRVIPLP